MPKIEYSLDNLGLVVKMLLSNAPNDTFCFYGSMGAGKTTLIKALVKELGAIDSGNSPSFGLVNEYHDSEGSLLAFHFDFYRINSLEEAMDIGLEEYFESSAYTFIEWPEKIEPLLPEEYLKITLSFIDENTRRIEY